MNALFDDILDFLEDQSDVVDGPDGKQLPNRAMILARELRQVAAKLTEEVARDAMRYRCIRNVKGPFEVSMHGAMFWNEGLDAVVDAALAHPSQGASLPPIERDEAMDRTYIPLPGGWEVQTQGKGSTFRICNTKTGDRWPVVEKRIHNALEQMARDAHEAATPHHPASAEAGMLRDPLARIHRDGGHYVAQHGLNKTVEDADRIVSDLLVSQPVSAEPWEDGNGVIRTGVLPEPVSAEAGKGVPAWYAVETPGGEFDISFVTTLEEARELVEQELQEGAAESELITPLYSRPSESVAVSGDVSEELVLRAIRASSAFGKVSLTYESGPYDIDRPTNIAMCFARAVLALAKKGE